MIQRRSGVVTMAEARRRRIITVPHTDDMDDETFIRHIEKRHAKQCKVEGYIARHAIIAWIKVYRAFHRRLHDIERPGQHDHRHDYPEDS